MSIHCLLRRVALCVGLSGLVLLTGCFETTQEFTLNPDGSGKVIHECRWQELDLFNKPNDTEEGLKGTVRKIIQEAKGVEAWSDITYRREPDGRIYFRGTAYFRRLADFGVANQMMQEFSWAAQGKGTMLLSQTTKKTEKETDLVPGMVRNETTNLSPAELAAKLEGDRAKFKAMKPAMEQTIGRMKHESIFHLPGKVAKMSNFESRRPGEVCTRFDGAKMLEVIEHVLNDEALLKKYANVPRGQQDPEATGELNAIMFGQKGPVQVEISGATTPLFDYAAEVQAARENFAKIQKELQVSVASVTSAGGGGFKNVKVAGVRLVNITGESRNLKPFDGRSGCTLSVLGEFPGAVLVVSEVALDTAVAADGSSLLPDSKWERKMTMTQVAADKTAVLFNLNLKMPGPGVTTLKKVSGRVKYSAEAGVRQVDLGFKRLESGATGTEMGAEIISLSSAMGGGSIELGLNLPSKSFKSAYLIVDGTKTMLRPNMTFISDRRSTITFASKWSIPKSGRIEIELVDEIRTFEAPFAVENVSLLPARAGL